MSFSSNANMAAAAAASSFNDEPVSLMHEEEDGGGGEEVGGGGAVALDADDENVAGDDGMENIANDTVLILRVIGEEEKKEGDKEKKDTEEGEDDKEKKKKLLYDLPITYEQGSVSALIMTSAKSNGTGAAGGIVIPLGNNMKPEILDLLVKRMRHFNGKVQALVEKPLKSKMMVRVTNAWDANFIDVDVCLFDPEAAGDRTSASFEGKRRLFQLTLAANYLEIKDLLALCCAKTACLIKGQPLDLVKLVLCQTADDYAKAVKKAADEKAAEANGNSCRDASSGDGDCGGDGDGDMMEV